jgi:hypothetical protein
MTNNNNANPRIYESKDIPLCFYCVHTTTNQKLVTGQIYTSLYILMTSIMEIADSATINITASATAVTQQPRMATAYNIGATVTYGQIYAELCDKMDSYANELNCIGIRDNTAPYTLDDIESVCEVLYRRELATAFGLFTPTHLEVKEDNEDSISVNNIFAVPSDNIDLLYDTLCSNAILRRLVEKRIIEESDRINPQWIPIAHALTLLGPQKEEKKEEPEEKEEQEEKEDKENNGPTQAQQEKAKDRFYRMVFCAMFSYERYYYTHQWLNEVLNGNDGMQTE